MMQNRRLHQLISKAALIVLSGFAWGELRTVAQQPQIGRQFPVGAVNRAADLPAGRVRDRLEKLPAAQRDRAVQWLRSFHFTEHDLQSLEIDSEGGVFYVDPPAQLEATPESTEPVTAAASVAISPFPTSLILHSKPGAPNIIYLDFDGETVTGTQWNTDLGRDIVAQAFSTDSDFTTFSDSEQVAIKRIWQRMAEDYAPFNVDVTTARPATFGSRTAHALITRNTQADGQANPASSAGGVAYVNVFGSSFFSKYRPAWVYYNNLANDAGYTAEAASHEVGHNLGLSHDGTKTSDYYGGHGSGEISWGPIMGTGYNRSVSQWSKGEYLNANNTQDDLATIAGKLTYLTDDHGNTTTAATPLTISGTNIFSTNLENDPAKTNTVNKGIIERNTDIDVFSFVTGTGPVQFTVNPWITPSGTRGNNLDVRLDLYSETGTLLLTVNPATGTSAIVQTNLAQGIYYLWVRNSGAGTPQTSPASGYTIYGSIGEYFISGYITPSTGFVVAPTAEVAVADITDAGVGAKSFVVTYSDNVGVDVSTINGSDVLVTGPNGYSKAGQFVSLDVNSNGTPRKATYSVAAPNGVSWLPADNGVYHIFMRPQEVADVEGAFVAERELGQFTVTVPVPIYVANMSANPGWTFDTLWAYGVPSKGSSGPTSGFTGANVIAYNLSGNYGNNINPPRFATTPAFSCAGSSTVTLKFQRWLRLERRDSATIEVSTNGVDWISIFSTSNPVNDTSWREVVYSLPASVAGKSSVRLRWGLGSNNSQNETGWAIDDVQVLGDGALDAAAPAAALNVANLTVAGAPSVACTITYTDTTAVRLASLDSQDILVMGPNGYSNVVEFVGADLPADGAAITASYSIPAPNGAWALGDNGDYEITLIEDQVDDVLNNFVPRTVLGAFKIEIPNTTTTEFQLNLSVNNAEWGTAQRSPVLLLPGAIVELTATPNQYYRFVEWSGGITGAENPIMLLMDGNKTVTANFAEIFTVSHPTPLWWLAQAGITNDFETAVNAVGANGLPLWQSFVAGLNPTNSESQLKLTAGTTTGGLALSWGTVTDRLYTVEFSESLEGPFVAVPNATDLPATTQSVSLAVSGAANGFYRIVVRKP